MTRLLWLADALRDEGLTVYEYPGWETAGRDAMTPAGFVWHDTVTSEAWSDWDVAQLLAKGRRDLPGPLSQFGLDRDGGWWVIASGVSHHAGRGGWQGLEGNHTVIGLEAFNGGPDEPWTQAQYESAVIGTAAIMRRLRRSASWLCGHKEWAPTRKIDPHAVDMTRARADVERAITQEEDVPLTDEDVERIATAVFQKLQPDRGKPLGKETDSLLRYARAWAEREGVEVEEA